MRRSAVLAVVIVTAALVAGLVEVASYATRHVGSVPVAAFLLGVPFTILGAMFAGCRTSTPVVARVRVHPGRTELR